MNRLENLITYEDNKGLKIKFLNVVLPLETSVGQFISVKGIPNNTVYVTGFLYNYMQSGSNNVYDYWDLQITLPKTCVIKKRKEYGITSYATVIAFYK